MNITTDIVHINSDLQGKENAVMTADSFNRRNGLSGKDALHIRLLTEELICLVHDIMQGFIGNLWLESSDTDNGIMCKVCLSAQRAITPEQENQLLTLASSGRNENSMGLLGRIREAIRLNMQFTSDNSAKNDIIAADSWYSMGSGQKMREEDKVGEILWSLEKYRSTLSQEKGSGSEEEEELERSIIAKLSDDVRIWITNDTTEVVIVKSIRK